MSWSRRPGRRIAGSIMSGLFVAPIINTFFLAPIPSISVSTYGRNLVIYLLTTTTITTTTIITTPTTITTTIIITIAISTTTSAKIINISLSFSLLFPYYLPFLSSSLTFPSLPYSFLPLPLLSPPLSLHSPGWWLCPQHRHHRSLIHL